MNPDDEPIDWTKEYFRIKEIEAEQEAMFKEQRESGYQFTSLANKIHHDPKLYWIFHQFMCMWGAMKTWH